MMQANLTRTIHERGKHVEVGFAGALDRRKILGEKMKPREDIYNRFARPEPIQPLVNVIGL
jgi:hypothetical protein